jgi:hypothetical protein
MFGRRELLLLIFCVGAVSALSWLAQVSCPVTSACAAVVHGADDTGHSPVFDVAGDSDQVPLVPRVVSMPLASMQPQFAASSRYRQFCPTVASSGPSRTLQQQRVLWQV